MSVKRLIIILHFVVGIGAVAGGTGGLLSPSGMGVSEEMLVNGPFTSFLIPSLFLFLILGWGNVLAGIITIRQWKYYPLLNIMMGGILCLWIMIQCYVLYTVVWLHVLYFMIGLAQLVLGCLQAWRIYKNH